MNTRKSPQFLERQSYKQRRLIDMIKVLPLVGGLLWATPMLWRNGDDGDVKTSSAIIFVFLVWIALVTLSSFLARTLGRADSDDPQKDS